MTKRPPGKANVHQAAPDVVGDLRFGGAGPLPAEDGQADVSLHRCREKPLEALLPLFVLREGWRGRGGDGEGWLGMARDG